MKNRIDKQTPAIDGKRIDVDQPLWNQDCYVGRWKHFAFISDCRTIFTSNEKLLAAKKLCEEYKARREPKSTTRDDILYAKKLRDGAFHPDNGELMNVMGRMSFQLPGSLLITVGMLTYYKTIKGIVGWQIVNQGFNSMINYTNRNAEDEERCRHTAIPKAFLYATTAGCAAAIVFRKLLWCRGSLIQQWAPFVAVATANMVNIPVVRQTEIRDGIGISTKDDPCPIMKSKVAGAKAISECVVSRIAMAAPAMLLIPVIMKWTRADCACQRKPWLGFGMRTALCGLFLGLMIPTGLAIYPQRNSMHIRLLKIVGTEYDEYRSKTNGVPDKVYYNKGL